MKKLRKIPSAVLFLLFMLASATVFIGCGGGLEAADNSNEGGLSENTEGNENIASNGSDDTDEAFAAENTEASVLASDFLDVPADTRNGNIYSESYFKEQGNDFNNNFVMKRGINIGNALESPKGVSWGVEIKASYFDKIKSAGFDTVRLPVRFSDYVQGDKHVLSEDFMREVDYFIGYALDRDLTLVLDFHHFEELMDEPLVYRDRFLKIWEQLSARYKDYPKELVFEVLNEPRDNLKGELWNQLLAEAISVIRVHNPERKLIVGGDSFNSLEGLLRLKIPYDKNLIATFHYYVPNDFAFQGNQYHEGYEHLKDITWVGDSEQTARLISDFEKVRGWADKYNVPVFLGEFGIVKTVPAEYRSKWIEAVKSTAEQFGFSWAYWELASHFGIYDDFTEEWDENALNALIE